MLVSLVIVMAVLTRSWAAEVTIGNVTLKGVTGTTYFSNRSISMFMGIPYAEPPVDERRFLPPLKKEWSGVDVLNATTYGQACPQIHQSIHNSLKNVFKTEHLLREDSESVEDCLFLDVYTPDLNPSTPLPVLFYIHGGSFIEGASHSIRPEFLLEYDLVLVAPQYRLGPLGFFTLANETGNAAMYDLIMALEWVRDNIAQFGGDPERITISGVSAGAASAALMYVSPLAQGKFSQILLNSGSALAPWTIDSQPEENSRQIAKLAGCANASSDSLLDCMKGVDASVIIKAYFQYMGIDRINGGTGMGGTIPSVGDSFLPSLPEMILSDRNFKGRPMLMSITRNEGIFVTDALEFTFILPNGLKDKADFLKYDLVDVLIRGSGIQDQTYTVAPAILEKYFNPDILGDFDKMKPGIIDYNGASYFKGPALRMAELNSMRNGTTYLTTFSYDPEGRGVNHASDMKYLFFGPGVTYTEKDLVMVKRLTSLYASFVIHGSPTASSADATGDVQWVPYTRENSAYLNINENLTPRQGFEQEFAITEVERRRSTGSGSVHAPWSVLVLLLAALYAILS